MLRSSSSSFFGQIVKVWYILKVFVKHDAWNEWGEGHVIEFPIKIFPKPTEFVGLQSSVAEAAAQVEGNNNGLPEQEMESVELEVDAADEDLDEDRQLYERKLAANAAE